MEPHEHDDGVGAGGLESDALHESLHEHMAQELASHAAVHAALGTPSVDAPPMPDPDTEPEMLRLNRNLNELLQELRISEVGVQILFAFLIALPFTARFGAASRAEKDVYVVTLLLAVLSSALMISPAAYHRIIFRHHRRAVLIRYASRVLLAGLSLLALALAGAIVVVTSFLFGSLFAAFAGGGVALWIAFFWYVIPVRTRLQCEREEARHFATIGQALSHLNPYHRQDGSPKDPPYAKPAGHVEQPPGE